MSRKYTEHIIKLLTTNPEKNKETINKISRNIQNYQQNTHQLFRTYPEHIDKIPTKYQLSRTIIKKYPEQINKISTKYPELSKCQSHVQKISIRCQPNLQNISRTDHHHINQLSTNHNSTTYQES